MAKIRLNCIVDSVNNSKMRVTMLLGGKIEVEVQDPKELEKYFLGNEVVLELETKNG